jgi:hypothetical protein
VQLEWNWKRGVNGTERELEEGWKSVIWLCGVYKSLLPHKKGNY